MLQFHADSYHGTRQALKSMNQTHLRFFAASLLALIVFTGNWAIAQPNILWIIADDFSPDISAYGTPGISTPNLDQLVSEGVSYTSAYSTAPVCSVSRSSFVTGMYATTLGAHNHRALSGSKVSLPSGVETVMKHFQDAGYFVSNSNSNVSGNGKTDYNFTGGQSTHFDGNDWRDRAPGQPFFHQVQVFQPHRSSSGFDFANNDPAREAALDLPDYYPDHPIARADYANYLAHAETMDQRVGTVLNRLASDGLADDTIVIFTADHGRPHVRDKQWLYEGGINVPLIVRDPFASPTLAGTSNDNLVSLIDLAPTSLAAASIPVPSNMVGEDFLDPTFNGKDEIYATRDRSGNVIDRQRAVLVKDYDQFGVTGDFKLIRNFNPDTSYMHDEMESVYKFAEYPVHTLMRDLNAKGLLTPEQANFLTFSRPEFELYDISADPNEFYNLADDPAFAQVLADLQNRIATWMVNTNDQGGSFDPDAAGLFNAREANLASRYASMGLPADAPDSQVLAWWANRLDVTPTDGDLNGDGLINMTDWIELRSNMGMDTSLLDIFDAFSRGDQDGNGQIDGSDFVIFKTAYELANGSGSFATLVANSVPEPSSILLIAFATAGFAFKRRSA